MKRKRVLVGLVAIVGLIVFFFVASMVVMRFAGTPGEFTFGGRIAVVEIRGIITQSSGVIEELRQHREDRSVKAIVLRIDSPGGGVGPSQEIYQEVLKTRKEKKVITSMGAVAASGGYYIACGSDVIVANPGTITGSIGVVMQFSNFEELLKKIGIKGVVIKSGTFKDTGSPFREMTPEERRLLQLVIDDVQEQFVQAVAAGRKMDRAKVAEIADGRILTGEQAKRLGLVDQLGNLQDTIDMAARLAGIEGRPQVIYPKRKVTLWDLVLKDLAKGLLEMAIEKGFELSYRMVPGR